MTTTMVDTNLDVSAEARETILSMVLHVQRIGSTFGPASVQYREANESLLKCLADLFRWDDLRVTRDGDLSLFCQARGIVFGLIFHATRRGCLNEGCRAVINDDGTAWTYMSDWHMCPEGQHQPSYPLDWPHPGTW